MFLADIIDVLFINIIALKMNILIFEAVFIYRMIVVVLIYGEKAFYFSNVSYDNLKHGILCI